MYDKRIIDLNLTIQNHPENKKCKMKLVLLHNTLEQLVQKALEIPSSETRASILSNKESIAYFLAITNMSVDKFLLLDPKLRSPLAFKLASLLLESMSVEKFFSLPSMLQKEILEHIDNIGLLTTETPISLEDFITFNCEFRQRILKRPRPFISLIEKWEGKLTVQEMLPILKNYTSSDIGAILHQIYLKKIAPAEMEAFNFVKKICFLGGDNKIADLEKSNAYALSFNRYFQSHPEALTTVHVDQYILLLAQDVLKCNVGRCGEQTALVALFLLSKSVANVHLIAMEGGNHGFIATGLDADTHLLDATTIPPTAIIIDTWGEDSIYLATEFPEKHRINKDGSLQGIPKIAHTYDTNAIPLSKEELTDFINYHHLITEQTLREQGLITGNKSRPLKKDHQQLLESIRRTHHRSNNAFFAPKTYLSSEAASLYIEKITRDKSIHSKQYIIHSAGNFILYDLLRRYLNAIFCKQYLPEEIRLEDLLLNTKVEGLDKIYIDPGKIRDDFLSNLENHFTNTYGSMFLTYTVTTLPIPEEVVLKMMHSSKHASDIFIKLLMDLIKINEPNPGLSL